MLFNVTNVMNKRIKFSNMHIKNLREERERGN